jgi:hypothetical protein
MIAPLTRVRHAEADAGEIIVSRNDLKLVEIAIKGMQERQEVLRLILERQQASPGKWPPKTATAIRLCMESNAERIKDLEGDARFIRNTISARR